mmetsp:Transcript_13507/g.26046  ORF Transcript_13507/g.26046 Transcript_13507/m.26046 type:complete len:520 (-) Transcript_13507:68-1627(-)|eukprot:CAMPEP_0171499548 /NCGR_PEP_ID=MMETSP0958-20121227/8493_1 /TAXON_ID=87120 /ORGANISM="Aurantiochytrium limacinum, Strain ATCCMYA-1381" /LENGTH=519 /DNA_ID=CAMNT_0012034123 /DNA_START=404 /DNA_END=1963 /DNA_ORIENTATION=+
MVEPSDSTRSIMQITVSDPMKHKEGMNAYVTYKVTTKIDPDRRDTNHSRVHRRYSDFVWLQERLTEAYPGLIIPPLPEKHVMRRFNEAFLSQRQRSLEKFLNRIANHEVLRDDRYVKAFLELESLEGTKTSVARHSSKSEKGSFWQWASAATSSLSTKMTGPSVQRPRTDDDAKFDELKEYVNALEPQMNAVHKHTHGLVEKNKEMAQALFDFGLAFTLLGQAEGDALGDAMQQLGQCADKLSRVTAVEADKETQFFDEPIKDYVRLVKQVKCALDSRTAKAQAYEALLGEVEAKTQARDRLSSAQQGADQQQATKLSNAEDDLRNAQEECRRAKEEHESVTQRLFKEMERFKREKLVDFKSIVLDYVQLQIEYNQKVEQSWRDVLPALQSLSGSGPAAPSAFSTSQSNSSSQQLNGTGAAGVASPMPSHSAAPVPPVESDFGGASSYPNEDSPKPLPTGTSSGGSAMGLAQQRTDDLDANITPSAPPAMDTTPTPISSVHDHDGGDVTPDEDDEEAFV